MKRLTTDQVLEKIGSFGRYQIVFNIFGNLCYAFWWAIPVMIVVFIAGEPGWKCKNNATCPFTEIIGLSDKRYSYRCNISREDWEFADDFTSIITEVSYLYIYTGHNFAIYIYIYISLLDDKYNLTKRYYNLSINV